MKLIPLTQGKFAKVDDEDFERLSSVRWCVSNGYATRAHQVNGRQIGLIMMHRAVMYLVDEELEIDHINHDTLNNQKSNLRIVTRSQNQQNKRGKKNGSSKYKGVSWCKPAGKWQVIFDKKGNGLFSDEREAALKYNQLAKEKFGEYAYLNDV